MPLLERPNIVALTAALALALPAGALPTGPSLAAAQAGARAAGDYEGATATGLALRRLGNTARVLHIAAHPDDENTALFAPIALGGGADAAYLSLTRGEGGQNGIGPELGIPLGVIRSEELLAARRLDGGEQFFARAIDYGYSRDAGEAFRHWPRDSLLADVVEVIRRYRPDVVISVWSGTDLDGHGQHEAAGILAREAVLAAADPARFPEQVAAGLRPHATVHYYRSAWFGEGEPDVELNTGALDPLLGRSYHQVAMASRGRHRSQDQGNREAPGPRRTAFDRVDPAGPVRVASTRQFGRYSEGAPRRTASLFEGVDTLLSQRAARAFGAAADRSAGPETAGRAAADLRTSGDERSASGDGGAGVVRLLRAYESLAAQARRHVNPMVPWAIGPVLDAAALRLDSARAALPPEADADLGFHLEAERRDLERARLLAANLRLDAVADDDLVVPGQTFRLELSVWNGGIAPVRARAEPRLPDGWTARPAEDGGEAGTGDGAAFDVAPGDRATRAFDVTVPAAAPPTTPYYLDPRDPAPADMYAWPADRALRGLPFAPAPVRAAFAIVLGGGPPIDLEREAGWIGVDPRAGEYRRPVKVVPAVTVALEPGLAVVPLDRSGGGLEFAARVRSDAPDPVRGVLELELPAGWAADVPDGGVALPGPGAERTIPFRLRPPAGVEPGAYPIRAAVRVGGDRHDLGYRVVDYPHIAPHHLYAPAEATVRTLDVEVADVRVGYVAGSGDGVPAALDQLGVRWQALDAADLANGALGRFDVLITGTRAYELRDDLVAANARILDWVRSGGTLIVQYNQYPALRRDYAPWPVTIARPHGRVTDETAPVRVLEPKHPALTTPNPIAPADWQGWVQERGLYFWDTWEGPLTPLLSMNDPGMPPLIGALLVGPLGEGTYVYTGLSLFRQLPAGVPGAYRLLANLISLGAG